MSKLVINFLNLLNFVFAGRTRRVCWQIQPMPGGWRHSSHTYRPRIKGWPRNDQRNYAEKVSFNYLIWELRIPSSVVSYWGKNKDRQYWLLSDKIEWNTALQYTCKLVFVLFRFWRISINKGTSSSLISQQDLNVFHTQNCLRKHLLNPVNHFWFWKRF